MRMSRKISSLLAVLFVVVLCFVPSTLWGEVCPFCYSKAMSTSAGLLRAFRNGIVVLMVPPFLMSIGITAMAYRRRNQFRPDDTSDAADNQRPRGVLSALYEKHRLN